MTKELVVISGKGGTGKTSITGSFAALAENLVIADCDVDAADLHLILKPEKIYNEAFSGGEKAVINNAMCTGCGQCVLLCRFNAIGHFYHVKPYSCEGCGVCAEFCPRSAIEMISHESGNWFISNTRHGTMVHARLGIAEGNSGKLVTIIKKKAHEIAFETKSELIIVDGSPGTGCPVIATITGASFVLAVTEPTVSGIHDLKRVFDLTKHFNVRCGVCINKCDINLEKTGEIESFCRENGIPLLGVIPYDTDVTGAQIAGKSVVEYSNGPAAEAIRILWRTIQNEI